MKVILGLILITSTLMAQAELPANCELSLGLTPEEMRVLGFSEDEIHSKTLIHFHKQNKKTQAKILYFDPQGVLERTTDLNKVQITDKKPVNEETLAFFREMRDGLKRLAEGRDILSFKESEIKNFRQLILDSNDDGGLRFTVFFAKDGERLGALGNAGFMPMQCL